MIIQIMSTNTQLNVANRSNFGQLRFLHNVENLQLQLSITIDLENIFVKDLPTNYIYTIKHITIFTQMTTLVR